MTMAEFKQSLVDDLKTELQITDENFDVNLLTVKVNGAVREVLQELGYSGLTQDNAVAVLNPYYMNIRNIALYDYNMVGAEFTTSVSESSTSRHFVDRNKLFAGILPLSVVNKKN